MKSNRNIGEDVSRRGETRRATFCRGAVLAVTLAGLLGGCVGGIPPPKEVAPPTSTAGPHGQED